MKIAKKLPIVRIENTLINLENLNTVWYDEALSGSGDFYVRYSMYNDDTTYQITFRTKKDALAALDEIMLAVDIPVIEEYEDD